MLTDHVDQLHQLSLILIERETIDKDQFERLLAGEAEESVFADESAPVPRSARTPSGNRRRRRSRSPSRCPGAAMQPPPDPDPA